MSQTSQEQLAAIQRHFHRVIRGRAAKLLRKHKIKLPELAPLPKAEDRKAWFPVLGMNGGFSYWLEGDGERLTLITESWCRVVGGSGQRHEITSSGCRLVDEGFV